MELQVSHEDGYVLARTIGPLDESARELFKEYLHPLVGQKGTKLVMDLSESKYISSMGIGQLVALVADANTNSSRVILADCAPFVATVMSCCKLDRFFEIAATVSEAVSRLMGK
jgi:anti-anti-sigma factor